MSAKTSHRRTVGTVKRGGRVEVTEMNFTKWKVTDGEGIMDTVYTLGPKPEGYRTVTLCDSD